LGSELTDSISAFGHHFAVNLVDHTINLFHLPGIRDDLIAGDNVLHHKSISVVLGGVGRNTDLINPHVGKVKERL